MSSAEDSLESLRQQLQKYEQKETAWETERLQLQNKLATAGTHLKSLAVKLYAQDKQNKESNNTIQDLNKQIDSIRAEANATNEQWQQRNKTQEEQVRQKDTLMSHLLSSLHPFVSEEPMSEEPPVHDVNQLEIYINHTITRLTERHNQDASAKQQDKTTIEELKTQIDELMSKSVASVKIGDEDKKGTDSDTSWCERTITSLNEIMQDAENGSTDNSLPSDLLQTFETLRTHLRDQADALEKTKKEDAVLIQDLKRQVTRLQLDINKLSEEKAELEMQMEEVGQVKDLQERLEEAERQKKESEERVVSLQAEHQSLLNKLAHIKETLMPRLEADKQLRHKVDELTEELNSVQRALEDTRKEMVMRDEETSQQLAQRERDFTQLERHYVKAQQERDEWKMMAMQMEPRCYQAEEQLQQTENELERLKTQLAEERQETESERTSLANLQTVLEEFQATKDAEIRAAVEHIERQLDIARKNWTEYQEKARVAETSLAQYQQDVAKAQQYEREIKEKNLLIGKLRHEETMDLTAIILNEHLVEAMRRLKEETNDSNVDRQLITNLVVGFFLAPRGDRKRFDILTIIASVLQMTDEQKEQIGLIRPKSGSRHGSSPGWQSPQQQEEEEPKESFTDAWISFLLKESSTFVRGRSTSNPSLTKGTHSPADVEHEI
ncbi:uncharacterized protein BYT42DRAFT_544720 [Radiomyces spectabilis]|uniref:uncharacterized protein n=1 Tax=Radiomyces spectabilis TaxID=64574 RepID=UPI00221FE23D|nr:uncharacterized protein BYT42DRAFT_544720 [Radiomyces spectabilis]KAI8384897.1 hypothetical protein BYT42DRAFT_544720 [Radiomyces spectabilis]